MSYQPVEHGVSPQSNPLKPSGGNERYTSAPVVALACNATSGTPRCEPIDVLPVGSAFWYAGFANTSLKPPPENVQPTSATPGNDWHFVGGSTLSTTRLEVLFGSVHRYV